MKTTLAAAALALAVSAPAFAQTLQNQNSQNQRSGVCDISPAVVSGLQARLAAAVADGNGGFFTPNRMWSAIVDRKGRLCSAVASDPDAWPGSRSIAIAKAGTANDFSNTLLALSTALLYSLTQPGGSLYGLNNSNPFNPVFQPQGSGIGFTPGGIITFGGGVPLYVAGQVVGGLGVSGDTACADHSVAFKMRKAAGLNGLPGGPGADNIVYLAAGEAPNGLKHPHCTAADVTPTP